MWSSVRAFYIRTRLVRLNPEGDVPQPKYPAVPETPQQPRLPPTPTSSGSNTRIGVLRTPRDIVPFHPYGLGSSSRRPPPYCSPPALMDPFGPPVASTSPSPTSPNPAPASHESLLSEFPPLFIYVDIHQSVP
jgi:hypothetical protein